MRRKRKQVQLLGLRGGKLVMVTVVVVILVVKLTVGCLDTLCEVHNRAQQNFERFAHFALYLFHIEFDNLQELLVSAVCVSVLRKMNI